MRDSVVALATLAALAAARPGAGQQVADTAFRPAIARPAFPRGMGPVIAIDEGHHNFHTVHGRYAPFAGLLWRDGYAVRGIGAPLTREALRDVAVLVVANPVHKSNVGRWELPTPSAFTDDEIGAVRAWVEAGGALLLIADHMPFAGAAERLAASFGLTYTNGFVYTPTNDGPLTFRRADRSLADHPITRGRLPADHVDSVRTFTGSAFQTPARAAVLLALPADAFSINPRVAWQFDSTTARASVGGWAQGATLRAGRGRVAAFGEAAMFSAQVSGPQRRPMGMNAPEAGQNATFLLNVVHWLTGRLD